MSENVDREETEPEDIGCIEAINSLYAYLDGEINDPETLEKIEHHLGHCRVCYSRRELEALLTERIRRSAKVQASESLHNRLKDLMDSF